MSCITGPASSPPICAMARTADQRSALAGEASKRASFFIAGRAAGPFGRVRRQRRWRFPERSLNSTATGSRADAAAGPKVARVWRANRRTSVSDSFNKAASLATKGAVPWTRQTHALRRMTAGRRFLNGESIGQQFQRLARSAPWRSASGPTQQPTGRRPRVVEQLREIAGSVGGLGTQKAQIARAFRPARWRFPTSTSPAKRAIRPLPRGPCRSRSPDLSPRPLPSRHALAGTKPLHFDQSRQAGAVKGEIETRAFPLGAVRHRRDSLACRRS